MSTHTSYNPQRTVTVTRGRWRVTVSLRGKGTTIHTRRTQRFGEECAPYYDRAMWFAGEYVAAAALRNYGEAELYAAIEDAITRAEAARAANAAQWDAYTATADQ